MRQSLMEILACPLCKGELALTVVRSETATDGEEEIVEGTLRCAACDEDYPIVDTIPNLLPPDLRRSMEAEQAGSAP